MGEFSKYVGEVGEEIVNDFLKLFGWKNLCNNKQLDCCVGEHAKKTHGIDALYVYNSMLQKQSLVSVVVSAKYSSVPYDKVKTTFRSHFKDLAHTIECYSKSQFKRTITRQFPGSSRKEDIGVLFYLNNDESDSNDNIKSQIINHRIDSTLKFSAIHLIDNARAKFLYNSINFIKKKHGEISFFCLNTTLNVSSSTRHSKIMPVEYITSPIIPISVPDDNGRKFILICDFNYSKESLILVYKLARKLCSDFANHYEIYFNKYNKLTDSPSVDEVKMAQSFEDGSEDVVGDITLIVDSYNNTFRSAPNEK
ncbi:GapS4a family protein [Raoultella ornithinolytica]|uniref:GapS4a family protein n=1 Tax=Raoultella ornithinolytica TaxID=54291 RepID=UPI00403D9E4C